MPPATPAQRATQWLFLAVRPMGGRAVGVRLAPSQAALNDALRREQLLLLRAWALPAWASGVGDVSLKDQASLNEQLALMLSRGVPLVESLDVASSVVSPAMRAKVDRMKELVQAGSSFADATETVGGFDAVASAVYRAAERTGDLGGAAARLASAARRRLAIASKALTLSIYPAVVLCISLIASAVMLTVVVPQVGSALEQAGAQLPAYSRAIIGAGQWMRANVLWVGLGALAAVVLAVVGRAILLSALVAALRRIPAVRRMQTAVEAARFFAVMGAMTRSGVPVADALAVASMAVSQPALRGQLENVRRRLVEGGLFRTLIEDVDALPLATRRLLIAAERSGDLDAAFDSLAADTADEVDRRSDRLLALLEPLLIVLMFLLIGSLLLAIMIPMITISSRVGAAAP